MSPTVGSEVAGPKALAALYRRRRYALLFYTLLSTLVAAPGLAALDFKGDLLELFLAASLLAALVPVRAGRKRRLLLAATMLAWPVSMIAAWFDHPALSALTLGMWTVIGLLAAAAALGFASRASAVDAEHLYAALSAYLLAGIFFGLFYWVLEQITPGSFSAAGEFSRMSALYFSFVTLATLGYGDIVPRTDVARGLAIVEGVGGQLFLAVLVARLVSLYGRGAPERSN